MRSDPSMALVAVIVVVAVVLLTRHGRTWWHRHTGEHHPARVGRLLIAGLALLGVGVLTAGMALGGAGGASADPPLGVGDDPDDRDDDSTAPGSAAATPVPAAPGDAAVTDSAGS